MSRRHDAKVTAWPVDRLARRAVGFRTELECDVLPFWLRTRVQPDRTGFVTSDAHAPRPTVFVVGHARLVWTFAHGVAHGVVGDASPYVDAVRRGHRHLRVHARDRVHGGYGTSTDPRGEPVDVRIQSYAQWFVLLALAETHRATGDPEALDDAIELFERLEAHARDLDHGGWHEHFESDWTPITTPSVARATIGRPGAKTSNAHLHALEALTALHQIHPTAAVRAALEHAIDMNRRHCFPDDPRDAHDRFRPDWTPIRDPRSRQISYGHHVEHSFLLIEAQRTLGRSVEWDLVGQQIDRALDAGEDRRRGGVVDCGPAARRTGLAMTIRPPRAARRIAGRLRRPLRSDKTWWVQAETMAALSELIAHDRRIHHVETLERLVDFVDAHLLDPVSGVWRLRVAVDGTTVDASLASPWKNGYHDVRAMVRFAETFDPRDRF